MTNALSLIISLGKEGKNPRDIAKELHARGVRDERGRTISPEMVSGFLRFVGKPDGDAGSYMPELFGAMGSDTTWGAKREPSVNRFETGQFCQKTKPKKLRKNRTGGQMPDGLKADVTRLFQEGMKPAEIAAQLGIPLRKIYGFYIMLSGFSVPPGEIEIIIESNGQKVMKCPPGYAMGAEPPANVKPMQGDY